MSGYFEQYGASDERRSKAIVRIVVVVAVLLIGGFSAYFGFRTYPAKRQVNRFLDDLRRKDYQAAYADWGCPKGCPDYAMQTFLEDWGPKSTFQPPSGFIRESRFCGDFVNIVVGPPKGFSREAAEFVLPRVLARKWLAPQNVPKIYLRYERDAGTLGFAPWQDACAAHVPEPGTSPSL